jgi:methionyl-tRNA formyltransferase
MKQLKIALLSTTTSEILGYIVEKLLDYKIPIQSVIMDLKISNDVDKSIWDERTQGQLPPIPNCRFENYYIPFYFFANHSSKTTIQFVKDSNIDLLINAGTPRILKEGILDAPKIGILNCHPGLLPDFRGCTCVEWAMYLDEKIGNTVHLMSKKIDEGPIIIQESLSFKKSEQYHDVRTNVYRHGFELMARGIKKITDNTSYDFKNAEYIKDGRYFKVIDNDKMNEVLNKVNSGSYAYQN